MGITDDERAARRRAVDEARHSIEMEGGRTDDDFRSVEEAFVRGEIEIDDLVARALRAT